MDFGRFNPNVPMGVEIDPHFYAAFSASIAACELAQLIGDGDLADELRELLTVQMELFCHMVEGKHYGSDALMDFIAYTDEMKLQAERLKQQ